MLAVIGSLGSVGKESGGFDDDIDTLRIPRDHSWVALGKYGDLFAVDRNVFVVMTDLAIEVAIGRVIFEQMSIGLGVG